MVEDVESFSSEFKLETFSERLPFPSGRLPEPWGLIDGRDHEAVANIVIRAAAVEAGIARIEIPKISDAARSALQIIREGRAEIVNGVRIGVIRDKAEAGAPQIPGLELEV